MCEQVARYIVVVRAGDHKRLGDKKIEEGCESLPQFKPRLLEGG